MSDPAFSTPPGPPPLDLDGECAWILRTYGSEDFDRLYGLMNTQLTVMHTRAQSLLTLAGVVISVTGFSGRVVAGTNLVAQALIIGGLALVLVSAFLTVRYVLRVRWLTQIGGPDVAAWLRVVLAYRNQKMAAYQHAVRFMLAGLTLYVAAMCVMLALPNLFFVPALPERVITTLPAGVHGP